MKEVTYGWYPSTKDIYRPKGRPSSYHLECLYKHGESLYYQGQVAPPEPELQVRGVSSPAPPTPQELNRKSRSVPLPKFSRVPKLHLPTPTECWSSYGGKLRETDWGVVGDVTTLPAPLSRMDWPLPSRKSQHLQLEGQRQQELRQKLRQQQERYFAERHQTPQYAWGLRAQSDSPRPPSVTADTHMTWPLAYEVVPVRPQSSVPVTPSLNKMQQRQQSTNSQKSRPVASANSRTYSAKSTTPPAKPFVNIAATVITTTPTTDKRPSRIQSATVRREKTPLPARPGTARSDRQSQLDINKLRLSEQPASHTTFDPSSRPPAAGPFIHDVNNPSHTHESPTAVDDHVLKTLVFNDGTSEGDDYNELLNKYGWRAEVHGDPYGLKKPSKRLSCVVACPDLDILPEPPKVHMETNEPFFYNTIPSRPLSFAVDKEWMSEILLAKRLELQKRQGGVMYNYKNFAFVY